MGKFNFNNPYRNKWCNETEKWLGKMGYVKNSKNNEKFTCPRCGRKEILQREIIRKSQFGYEVCLNCYEDEIIRDSIGEEQIDTKYWYIFSKKNMI